MRTVITWLLRLVLIAWWLLLAFVVIQFYLDNNAATVSLKVVSWAFDDVMVSQLVLGLVVGSLLLAVCMLAPWIWLLRVKNARLKRQLAKIQVSLKSVVKADI